MSTIFVGYQIRLWGTFRPAPGEDMSDIDAVTVTAGGVAVTGVQFAAAPNALWTQPWVAAAGIPGPATGDVLWTALWAPTVIGRTRVVSVASVGGGAAKSAYVDFAAYHATAP